MQIEGKTALVTGANRGLGRHLASQLRDRGATVYAAARNPAAVDLPGVTPVALDVTDPASVAAAAAAASGVAILVNNAGTWLGASLLTGDLADIHLEMDTHFFGTVAVTRAFALSSPNTRRQIIADEPSRRVLARLSAGVAGLYPQLANPKVWNERAWPALCTSLRA
jgi:NAD(P)-dependent dehydrogenase (short-subunit alcohol dehydrogenase family)